jgi:hypothetical protein
VCILQPETFFINFFALEHLSILAASAAIELQDDAGFPDRKAKANNDDTNHLCCRKILNLNEPRAPRIIPLISRAYSTTKNIVSDRHFGKGRIHFFKLKRAKNIVAEERADIWSARGVARYG